MATTTEYDALGQPTVLTQPDNTTVTNSYDLMGQLTNTCGSRTYPVAYTYDYAGRMKTMTTWTNYSGDEGAALTTWNYDSERGWLNNKRDNDSQGADYTYTDAGRLKTRTWARDGTDEERIVTTYTYGFEDGNSNHEHGDLVEVSYSANDPASTPGTTYTYDRQGRQKTIVRDGMTATREYNDAGQLFSESYSGGALGGLSVTNGYDAFLRRTNLSLLSGSTLKKATSYGYDAAGRLARVESGLTSATYDYLANNPLVEQINFTNNGVLRMTTIKEYDNLNRLLIIASVNGSTIYSSNSYAYNLASQRTSATNEVGNRWDYAYDDLGQLKQGWQYTNGSTLISGRDFDYVFDDIGNRQSTTNSSNATNYTANLLNQYTAVGSASPTYDLDGNLTNSGAWVFTWDAENRLVAAEKSNQRLEFAYDWQGRRIQKKVYSGSTGNWTLATDDRFIYDGWNLIARANSSLTAFNFFCWGLDLSGSLQGAGGVGGLLWAHFGPPSNYAAYDGNGNIMALVRNDGTVTAKYEYGPFGELITATGTLAFSNPFRFSTKYQDDETDLLYYGYRYYNPSTGRWLSRDPIGEEGELNVHSFVRNNPLTWIDPDGRLPIEGPIIPVPDLPPTKPPADNPCDGYKSILKPKCFCNCELIKDGYSDKAERVCNGFMKRYDWSDSAQCVARCLVKSERFTRSMPFCSDRAHSRLLAHVQCYRDCGFVPYLLLPEDGLEVGLTDLYGVIRKCQDSWKSETTARR